MAQYINNEYVEMDFKGINLNEAELRNCTFIKCRFRSVDASEILT